MAAKPTQIRRNLALDEMDIRWWPDGSRNVFSVKFVTKTGEIRYFPHAYSSGAGRMNNRLHRVKGIVPCDSHGNAIGHPYPVNIDALLMYNNMKIIL